MQQAFLNINGVRTNVLTYGRWVEESFQDGDPQDLIILIPGNPGVTGFYKMLMHILSQQTGYPVWLIGHAGHETPKNNNIDPVPPLKGHEEKFGLTGQIQHKVEFFEKFVIPSNARLHLVGHSIGAFIALELMKIEAINSKVIDAHLLFPTIEHMATTPNGKFLTTFIKPILPLVLFLSLIFTILPTILQNFLMYVYMKVVCMPKMHFRTLINFVNPSVLEKVFFMAFEELHQVKARDNEVIRENLRKIQLLYGEKDGWAPKTYCDRIKEDIPGVLAENSKFDHSFVLKQSREVGNLIATRIVAK